MNSDLLQGFYLGELFIEPLKGQVTGSSGSKHIPPKAVEVLLCLARQPGDLVSRTSLLDDVWGDGNGSSEALGHAVSEIRQAFDDHPDDPQFIQTLPKRGYRLLLDPMAAANSLPPPKTAETDGSHLWSMMLRHGVVQAGVAYLVVGWLIIQVADATFSKIGLPIWSEQFITFVVIFGFPLLLILAWFLEFAEGRFERDTGAQSGGIFQGLERNYLAIFVAYGMSAIGVLAYQVLIGFEMSEATPVAVAEISEDLAPVPVAENSLAVLKLLSIDNDERTRTLSDGLSEDILDELARIPGILVSARGDSWSLPPNAASGVVRRRLRVENYIEGSVRFDGEKLRVVIQLIDSSTGFHRFSRGFEVEVSGIREMQSEITKLVVANMKLTVTPALLQLDSTYAKMPDDDAYYLFLKGREALARPRSVANITEAISYFDQSLKIDHQYPAALAGKCAAFTGLYDLRNDPENIALAESACAEALAVAPRVQVVLNSVARLYFRTGRYDDAEEMYSSALQIDEQDVLALQGIARIYRREQRFEDAERLMQRAIELQPGNWNSINALGNLFFGMGRFVEAAAEYRKVVYLNPENFITLGNLASANLMTGDFAAARDTLLESIAIEENTTFQANLGAAYYYLGDYSDAVGALQRSVELAPSSAGNWMGLADALVLAGDHDEADVAYAKTIELARQQIAVNHDDTEGLMFLAWSLAMTDKVDEAIAHASRAVALDPADPYSHYFHALTLLRSGDTNTAIEALSTAKEYGYPVAMLASEPILNELRADSRFTALLVNNKN